MQFIILFQNDALVHSILFHYSTQCRLRSLYINLLTVPLSQRQPMQSALCNRGVIQGLGQDAYTTQPGAQHGRKPADILALLGGP